MWEVRRGICTRGGKSEQEKGKGGKGGEGGKEGTYLGEGGGIGEEGGEVGGDARVEGVERGR